MWKQKPPIQGRLLDDACAADRGGVLITGISGGEYGNPRASSTDGHHADRRKEWHRWTPAAPCNPRRHWKGDATSALARRLAEPPPTTPISTRCVLGHRNGARGMRPRVAAMRLYIGSCSRSSRRPASRVALPVLRPATRTTTTAQRAGAGRAANLPVRAAEPTKVLMQANRMASSTCSTARAASSSRHSVRTQDHLGHRHRHGHRRPIDTPMTAMVAQDRGNEGFIESGRAPSRQERCR